MQIFGFNTLDLLLLFILFMAAIVGMLRGVGPQLMSAASIWLALLASLWTYRLLSVNIFIESGWFNKIGADAMSFMIMFIVCFHSIRLVIRYLTKPPEEKKKKPQKKGRVGPAEEVHASPVQRFIVGPIMYVSGALLGIFITALWLAIILGVMQFFFQVNLAENSGASATGQGLVVQMQSSSLMPYFNRILWLLVKSLDLFMLDKSADILKNVVCTVFANSC